MKVLCMDCGTHIPARLFFDSLVNAWWNKPAPVFEAETICKACSGRRTGANYNPGFLEVGFAGETFVVRQH